MKVLETKRGSALLDKQILERVCVYDEAHLRNTFKNWWLSFSLKEETSWKVSSRNIFIFMIQFCWAEMFQYILFLFFNLH